MGVCVWDFVMSIIIVFVYFFDSTCCVTWESIGIFCFVFVYEMYLNRDEWDCLRERALSLFRARKCQLKRVREIDWWVFCLFMMCVLVLVKGWNQTESVQNGGACFGFECVCCVLEKLSSRLFFQPFSFSHVFLFTLISRVV